MEGQNHVTSAHPLALWLAWWAVLVAVWLLFVDTVQWEELVVGAVAAAISATVAVAVHRRGYIRFSPRLAWIRDIPTRILDVGRDCGLLAVALWRTVVHRQPVTGSMIRVPFVYGGDNGRDGARRALLNFAVSLTPNTYVVDIDPEANSLLIHQLCAGPLDRLLSREKDRAEHVSEYPADADSEKEIEP